MSANYGMALHANHAAMLAASGITPEHARARRYVTVDTKVRLEQLGITPPGRNVPGLLVPSLRVDGSVWGYQYRPDHPRIRSGKPVKYETPTKQRNGLDVPPGVGPKLADPAVPLWVTEGIKKADAAALAGLACVALPGVWSWRGTNVNGGKTAISDWHDVALNGRRVIIAFDSDVTRKRPVRSALNELAGYLTSKGANVRYLHLPDDDPGKTGLDDYLAAGHDAGDLLALVRPEPPALVEDRATPEPEPPAPELWRLEPVPPHRDLDGATLLDQVEAFLSRFIAFPSEHTRVATTLWAAHTHALDAFETTPRLAFLSPEPGSGKTRALEILELLVLRALLTVNVTPAYLFRKVSDEAGRPTILYDEIDTVFGPKAKDNEEVRGMLNSGYRNGATAGRCVVRGKIIETEDLPSYAAVALAGLDDLPDTIMSRSIIIRMRRRAPHEHIDPYRHRVHQNEGHQLRGDLTTWVSLVWAKLHDAWPDLPIGIEDRNADIWEPLLTIADAAGGDWPKRARCSAVALVADSMGGTHSFGVRLLADLRTVFGNEPFIPTGEVLEQLCALDESPWGDLRGKALTARGLSQRLSKYEVKSKQQRIGDKNHRGYERTDLLDAWVRYLPGDDSDAAPEPLTLPSYIPLWGIERESEEILCDPPYESATSATPATDCLDCGNPLAPQLIADGEHYHVGCTP